MSDIAKLAVILTANASPLAAGMATGAQEVKTFEDKVSGMGGTLDGVAGKFPGFAAAAVGAFAAIAAGAAVAVKALELMDVQDQAEMKLDAVLKSTGNAAGFTGAELRKMAGDLQNVTTFGDETTISAMAVLATFTSIKGDQFKGATVTAQNLSAVLGQDLQSSVIQIGKALNDPVQGVTALRRVGVSFTEAQLKQIEALQKSGDLMGAQSIILKELETEFGGAATAMTQSFGGMFRQMKNAAGDAMEMIGKALVEGLDLPGILGDAKAWADENGPKLMEGLKVGLDVLKPVVWAVWDVLKGLGSVVADVIVPAFIVAAPVIKGFVEPLATLVGGIGKTIGAVSGVFREALQIIGALPGPTAAAADATVDYDSAAHDAANAAAALATQEKALAEAHEKVVEEVTKLEAKMQAEVATFGMSAQQKEVYKLATEGATEADLAHVQALADQLDALKANEEQVKAQAKAWEKMQESAKKLADDILDPWEKLAEKLDEINGLEKAGLLTADQATKASQKATNDAAKAFGLGKDRKEPKAESIGSLNALEKRFTRGFTDDRDREEALKAAQNTAEYTKRTADATETIAKTKPKVAKLPA